MEGLVQVAEKKRKRILSKERFDTLASAYGFITPTSDKVHAYFEECLREPLKEAIATGLLDAGNKRQACVGEDNMSAVRMRCGRAYLWRRN